MPEVDISPSLRRIEKLDVHRNSKFMSLIALKALQINNEPVSLLEIVRSLSGCLNQLDHFRHFETLQHMKENRVLDI